MLAMQARLLLADADSSVRRIVKIAAEEEGWQCDEAANGIMALKLFRHEKYDLVVLDADLPELDGKLVCRQIRKTSGIPLLLTGKGELEDDRLSAFAAGGNDYVIKPFYPRELIARVKSLITLSGKKPESKKELAIGKLTIDFLSRTVRVGEREVVLAPKEYDLLLHLCQNPAIAYSRDKLLNLVWGEDFFGTDRTVDTHVKSIRNKIKPYHYYIVTVWGYGYKFEI